MTNDKGEQSIQVATLESSVKRPPLRRLQSAIAHAFAYDDGRDEISADDFAMLDKVADWVARRDMAMPAMLILEGSTPLNFIGSSLMSFFRPVVGIAFNTVQWERFERLLEKRCAMRLLSERIEARQAVLTAKRAAERKINSSCKNGS